MVSGNDSFKHSLIVWIGWVIWEEQEVVPRGQRGKLASAAGITSFTANRERKREGSFHCLLNAKAFSKEDGQRKVVHPWCSVEMWITNPVTESCNSVFCSYLVGVPGGSCLRGQRQCRAAALGGQYLITDGGFIMHIGYANSYSSFGFHIWFQQDHLNPPRQKDFIV